MPYHLDFNALRLDFLEKRLGEEDLIPGQLPLRLGMTGKLKRLGEAGIGTLEDLDRVLSKEPPLLALAKASGVGSDYLKLLGRALRGWRPKPAVLAEYPGVDKPMISKLARAGIRDSRTLWEAAHRPQDRARLTEKTGIDQKALLELVRLDDLSRIQWVSPLFARLLHDSGFTSVRSAARAEAADIYGKVDAVNREKKLFKGKIGPRDMGRLVYLASLLPHELTT